MSEPWIRCENWVVSSEVGLYAMTVVGPCAPGVLLVPVPGLPGYLAPAYLPGDEAAEAAWRLTGTEPAATAVGPYAGDHTANRGYFATSPTLTLTGASTC